MRRDCVVTLLLSTIPYRALSPSYLQAIALPVELAYDGQAWRIGINGAFGPRPFKTRDEAADLVAQVFRKASA